MSFFEHSVGLPYSRRTTQVDLEAPLFCLGHPADESFRILAILMVHRADCLWLSVPVTSILRRAVKSRHLGGAWCGPMSMALAELFMTVSNEAGRWNYREVTQDL